MAKSDPSTPTLFCDKCGKVLAPDEIVAHYFDVYEGNRLGNHKRVCLVCDSKSCSH